MRNLNQIRTIKKLKTRKARVKMVNILFNKFECLGDSTLTKKRFSKGGKELPMHFPVFYFSMP